jgi:site-specific recombinase XerD
MENRKQTFTILFYIVKSKINKNGEVPIYARITVNGVRSELSINRVIDENRWDSSAGKVKGNKEDARTINEHIDTIRTKIGDHQNTLIKNNKLVTSSSIKNSYSGITEKKLTLIELFKYHNQQMKEKVDIDFSNSTVIRYTTTLKHITDFLKINYKTSDMYLTELNYKFITEFEHYLKTVRKCNHNSTIKYIRNVRKVVNIALANDWLMKDPFLKFRGSIKEVERDFLSTEELQAIEDKEFKISRLDEVRDMFVFSCYTGLAYADIAKLSLNEIEKGIDGERWIYTHREKTETKSNIPLLPKALEIIEKYKKHPECIISGKLLPVRSNQKMNAYLKEIADVCDITKNLTFHSARHTAATTVWLTNGVPIESVSSMLGHKNIRTTQIYAKVVEKKVSEDMQNLRSRLLKNSKKKSIAV